MKILEAIKRVDSVKPNRFTIEDKVNWLSDFDGIIFKEIVSKHENPKIKEFIKYSADNQDRELLIDDCYAEVYDHWLESKIDYYNGEFNSYNNSVSMYNNAYETFVKNYRQDHLPITNRFKFGFKKGWR